MPCRRQVKDKAILDGIQVSTLAGMLYSSTVQGVQSQTDIYEINKFYGK